VYSFRDADGQAGVSFQAGGVFGSSADGWELVIESSQQKNDFQI